jgi:succinoglycan biosynthesis protein ExoA
MQVTQGTLDKLPFVTVVMPVYNEESFIKRSLGAVLAQDYPHRLLEIIIAEGISDDGTSMLLEEMLKSHPHVSVKILTNHGRSTSKGLNRAISEARGEVIVRVDGHSVIAQDYVRQCVLALRRSGAQNVGGRMKPVGECWFSRAVALATTSPFGIGASRFHYSNQEEFTNTVYLGAWPRRVFERVGMFSEDLEASEDYEFNHRLLEQGGRILLSPVIKSMYFPRATLSSLFRQYLRYGLYRVRVIQKHPRSMRLHHFLPPALTGASLSLPLLTPFSLATTWLLLSILGSYLVASLLATLLLIRREPLHLAPLIPLVFATIHLAYGLGFIVGILRFFLYRRVLARTGRAPLPDSY